MLSVARVIPHMERQGLYLSSARLVSDPGVVVLHESGAACWAQRGRRGQALQRQQQQPGEPTRLQLAL